MLVVHENNERYTGLRPRTARINDICGDILRCNLWRDGHLWYDVLHLRYPLEHPIIFKSSVDALEPRKTP